MRIRTNLPITEWNCETGEITAVEAETSKGCKIFDPDFPMSGNKLWGAGTVEQTLLSAHLSLGGQTGGSAPQEATGPFDYALSEPNLCVLDAAEYRIDGGDRQPETDVLKIDRQIREERGILRRGGEMLQPWFTAQHPVKELCDAELRYTFEIETMPEWIDLVIEEPENFIVELNGRPLDLSVSSLWIDIAFHRIRIPGDIPLPGKNEITLKTRYKENSNLEAVYLLGEFGVQLDGAVRRIGSRPEKLAIGDLCAQGFPFYSGAVTYRVPVPAGADKIR
ncbi:MAG: hypothetical protein PQJ50_11215, partial [Spirochaetales bacterium]|nr:hypothetical protein [Spirochaetales bacterium]